MESQEQKKVHALTLLRAIEEKTRTDSQSDRALGRLIGIQHNTVRRIRLGQQPVSDKTLAALERKLAELNRGAWWRPLIQATEDATGSERLSMLRAVVQGLAREMRRRHPALVALIEAGDSEQALSLEACEQLLRDFDAEASRELG